MMQLQAMQTSATHYICAMIELRNISRSFGKKQIFSDLSFDVETRELCGLVGLNGVGKTTLLRIIAGTLGIGAGTVSIFGTPPQKNGEFYRKLGIVLDNDGFNGNISFLENLRFFAQLKHVSKIDTSNYVEQYWSHLSHRKTPVKHFSRGERMQCGLARAFLGKPKLLLLDEPASNLDMEGYALLCRLISDAHSYGASAIISSHRLDAISELCSSVAFLDQNGLRKISLSTIAQTHWVLRGVRMDLAITVLKSFGAHIDKNETDEIFFNGITREQITTIIPELISCGVQVWELFLRDPVQSAMENSYAQ